MEMGTQRVGTALFESTMDGMAVLEGDEYVYVNDAHAELYGFEEPADMIGETWRRLYDEEQVERFEQEVFPEVEKAGEWRGRAVGRRRDGEPFEQEVLLAQTGNRGLVCVVRDISDRADRRRRVERQATILESIRDGVYTLDENGVITWVNAAAVDEFDAGYTREDLVGSNVSMLMSDADIERCLVLIEELITDPEAESRRCEVELKTAYGDTILAELNITLLPYEDGNFQGTVGVVRDLTKRKRRGQQLSVLNRLLRHNLRNRLSVLLGHLDLHEESGNTDHLTAVRDTAHDVLAVSEKASRLEAVIEADERGSTTLDVVEVIEEVLEPFRKSHPGASITLEASERQLARADDRLGTVVGELVENAIEHGGEGPAVTVRITPPTGDAGTVSVTVADNGPGIPDSEVNVLEADRERPLSHTSGLGLWYVRWYADSRGAGLSFASTDEGGSAVTLELRAP